MMGQHEIAPSSAGEGGGAVRTTEWIRDASGNPTTRRITGVERGSVFNYDTAGTFNAAGQPLTGNPDGHASAGMPVLAPG